MTKQRKYDDEFKEDAVNLMITTGKGVCETARDLGIPESCVGRWYQKHLKKLDGNAKEMINTERLPSDIEKENRRVPVDSAWSYLSYAESIFDRSTHFDSVPVLQAPVAMGRST